MVYLLYKIKVLRFLFRQDIDERFRKFLLLLLLLLLCTIMLCIAGLSNFKCKSNNRARCHWLWFWRLSVGLTGEKVFFYYYVNIYFGFYYACFSVGSVYRCGKWTQSNGKCCTTKMNWKLLALYKTNTSFLANS